MTKPHVKKEPAANAKTWCSIWLCRALSRRSRGPQKLRPRHGEAPERVRGQWFAPSQGSEAAWVNWIAGCAGEHACSDALPVAWGWDMTSATGKLKGPFFVPCNGAETGVIKVGGMWDGRISIVLLGGGCLHT